MWTTETTLKLIEDLHSNVCLWDMECIDYKNKNNRRETLDHLAKKFEVPIETGIATYEAMLNWLI